MPITIATQSHSQRSGAPWLIAKIAVVVIAIALFSLLVVAIEQRCGVVPSDSPIPWELSGE